MFDPISTQTSSVNCAGLDFFDSAVDFNDLAFLNMVLCMQESDSALAAKMGEIREMNKEKKAINEKIANLNSWLTSSDAKDAKDKVYVKGGLDNPTNANDSNMINHEDPKDPLKATKEQIETARTNMYGSLIRGDVSGYRRYKTQLDAAENKLKDLRSSSYTKEQVEKKVEELRGQLEDMNSSSSIMMIDLQRLMNKRNEASQLVSNIVVGQPHRAHFIRTYHTRVC